MSCLAYVVDVIVEGQSVVCCHTETLYCSCDRNSNAGDCDVVDLWFRPCFNTVLYCEIFPIADVIAFSF